MKVSEIIGERDQRGRGEAHSFCWLWKLTRPSTVVKVKRRSIESNRMNLEIVNQATSIRSNEEDEKVSFELDLPSPFLENAELTKKHHQRHQMHTPQLPAQSLRRVPSNGNHQDSIGRHHHAPGGVVEVVGVGCSGFELEGAVVSSHESSETDEHLSERRVDAEEEEGRGRNAREVSSSSRRTSSRVELGTIDRTGSGTHSK